MGPRNSCVLIGIIFIFWILVIVVNNPRISHKRDCYLNYR